MIERFRLATLANLDGGRIQLAFEQAMKRCEDDCKDRPGNTEVRKVALVVLVKPGLNDGRDLESCEVQFQVVDSVPKKASRVFDMKCNAGGGLLFNEMSPDDVRQTTLDMVPQLREVNDAS